MRIISIEEVISGLPPKVRSYKHEGNFYLFRDVPIGDRKLQCQYGVLDTTKDDESVIWKDCDEGSEFAMVEPFAKIGSTYRTSRPLDPLRNQSVANQMVG